MSADLRVGSLCTGYGGLDQAVVSQYGGTVAWISEFDKHAAVAAEAAHPGAPNYGDLTVIDWAAVEPVDILTAGYPCQPFSVAGQRRGAEDERHIWPWIANGIRVLRPRLVVLENVAGHLRLGFDTVLADLAGLGYDARWGVVRASDAGACHQRARLFIVAHPADTSGGQQPRLTPTGDRPQQPGQHHPRPELLATPRASMDPGSMQAIAARRHNNRLEEDIAQLLPTPTASDTRDGKFLRQSTLPAMARGASRGVGLNHLFEHNEVREFHMARGQSPSLLPTPVVNDMGAGKTVAAWDEWTERLQQSHGNGNGHGASLSIEVQRDNFGQYQPAIDMWTSIIGRPPPNPVVDDRLNPAFVEWMMGLPAGHVTGLGLSTARQLKILGNGVVPQQAALALRLLDGLDD